MIYKNPLLSSLLLNTFFLFLYLILGELHHSSLDDYFMSGILTGAYGGNYDVHLYFVNSAYAFFLKPFYWLFPKVGWYFLFELVGMFASFITISFLLIRQQGIKWGIALSVFFLSSLSLDFYFQVGFTQCATLYTATGILSTYTGISENKKRFLILGGLFLIAGSVMRYEGFLLGIPYIIVLLSVLLHSKKKLNKKNVVILCLIIASIYSLREYDRNLYMEGDYKYYANYQPIRSYFGDGAFYDKESTYDELEERNMSGPDFYLLKSWVFYDTKVFNIDSLNTIWKITQHNLYEPNYKRMLVAFLMSISNAFTRYSGWCWFILCTIIILGSSKKASLYPWLSLSLIGLSIGYLLWVNRLVYHVESGIWLYAIVSAIPLLPIIRTENNPVFFRWNKVILILIMLTSFFFVVKEVYNHDWTKSPKALISIPEMPSEWVDFVNYTQDHPNDAFLLSFERYKSLGSFKNPAYMSVEPGSWNNIFTLGYWNIHFPAMKNELEKRGVENPLQDIVHDNVYLLEDGKNPSLEDYYKRHYQKEIKGEVVRQFGDLFLLKYHIIENIENSHE